MLGKRIKFLFNIIHDLYRIDSYDNLINTIVERTAEILNARRVSLMLYDNATEKLKIVASKGISSSIVKKTELFLGQDIAGISLKNKQYIFSEDIEKLCEEYGIKRNKSIKSSYLIVIPLFLNDKLIGTLNVTDIENPGSISKRDEEIIISISSHIAMSIDRQRLVDFQKLKIKQAMTLFEISKTLNSYIDIQDTLNSFMDILSNLLGVNQAAVYIYKESTRTFILKENFNVSQRNIKKIADILVNNREEFCSIQDVFHVEKVYSKDYYFLPLKHEKKTIGILMISGKDSKSSTFKHDIKFLSILASQVAIILGKEILLEKLSSEKEKFRILNHMGKELSTCFQYRGINEILSENLKYMFDYDISALIVFKNEYKSANFYFGTNNNSSDELVKESYEIIQSFLRLNKNIDKDIKLNIKGVDPKQIYENKKGSKLGSHLIMPLIENNALRGVFFIGAFDIDAITLNDDLELFSIVGNGIAASLEKSMLFKENERLAFTDPMTSTYNYRFFKNRINQEFERAIRYKTDLSLMIIDIDFFKYFNDNFGHQQGDKVLKETASILKESVRQIDIVARYGGEEFVVILPETGIDSAAKIAQRIRQNIEKNDFTNITLSSQKLHITVSIGLSSYRGDIKNINEFIDFSDACLYKAKNNGRNRVCYYDGKKYREKKNTDS